MAPKSKKGRGKTLNLTEFNEDFIPESALDWAEDDWVTNEQKGEAKLSEKIAKQRQEYSRVANNTLGAQESFRTAAASQPQKKFTIEDLQAPFVGHFGNLRNGTSEEEFLALFPKENIVTHRIINQDGKSFAFVEFNSAQSLTAALSLDQTFQRGRRMYVDLATAKQVERLLNRGTNERPGLSRDGAGQQQHGGLASTGLSRDVFGGPQPDDHPGMPSMNSRSNFGSRADLHTFGDLSRDMLGSAVQQASPNSASPLGGSAGSPVDFSAWRTEAPEQQPQFAALRENGRSDDNLDRRSAGAANLRRNSSTVGTPAAPVAQPEPKVNPFGGEMGNWRDAPRVEAPKREENEEAMKEEAKDTKEAKEGKEGQELASPNSPAPTGRGGRGGRGGAGRGGAGRGGNSMAERNVAPKSAGPVNADKWGDFRR